MSNANLSPQDLETLLIAQANATFVGGTFLTRPTVRKGRTRTAKEISLQFRNRKLSELPAIPDDNPHYKQIHKISILTGSIKFCFQSVVRKAQTRAGHKADFLAKARRWGHQLRDTPVIYHNVDGDDRVYMHVLIHRRHDHYFDSKTCERLDYETQVWPYERIRPEPDHGVDNYREFTLTNVAELRSRGKSLAMYPCRQYVDRYFPSADEAA